MFEKAEVNWGSSRGSWEAWGLLEVLGVLWVSECVKRQVCEVCLCSVGVGGGL